MARRPKPPRRLRRIFELTEQTWERIPLLIRATGDFDHHELAERSFRLLDRVVCAVFIEGAEIHIKHRDGRTEILDP
jgi:hypothetical protein